MLSYDLRKKAFTLPELIASISLLFVICGFLLYNNSFLYIKQKQELNKFISDINYIKQLSFNEDRRRDSDRSMIKLDRDNNCYYIKTDTDNDKIVFGSGIKLESYSNDTVIFRNRAHTTGNTIKISLSKNGRKKYYLIKISAIRGRVKLEEEK